MTKEMFDRPYDVMLSKKAGGLVFPRSFRDWLGISLLLGGYERLPLHHLFFRVFFLSSLIKLSLSQPMGFL